MKVPFIEFIQNMTEVHVLIWEGIEDKLDYISRIPHWISKHIFVLGSYEFVAML